MANEWQAGSDLALGEGLLLSPSVLPKLDSLTNFRSLAIANVATSANHRSDSVPVNIALWQSHEGMLLRYELFRRQHRRFDDRLQIVGK
jgi:hypothetical protein